MSRSGRSLLLALCVITTGVFVACGVKVDTQREGFPCDPDGGCASGLVCSQGTCVSPAHLHADGGAADGGTGDAGTLDGGGPDAGSPDGGMPDGGAPDAGLSDAGTPDAGPACGTSSANPCAGCGDGTTCTTAGGQPGVCSAGACFHGCLVKGTPYAAGDANPANACEVCDPTANPAGFVAASDGTACATDHNPCTDDVCAGGQCTHPASARGTPCGGAGQCDGSGTCSAGCDIGQSHYAAGAVNPNNPCQVCDPATSGTAWSLAAPGTTCGTGQICDATGACQTGCYIGGTRYAAGDPNPANACETCDPQTSTGAFTPVSNGTVCGAISGCGQWGTCGPAAGAGPCDPTGTQSRTCTQPTCQSGACTAASLTQKQSCTLATDGNACATDNDPCTADVCAGGTCTHPALSTGATCGTGMACNATGACVTGCVIGGQTWLPGTTNPANPCEVCAPAVSTTTWSPGNAGATCQATSCSAWGTCTAGTPCATSGTQTRSCTAYTCGGGSCNPSSSSQSQSCTRSTNGTACASDSNPCTADACSGGACTHTAVTAGTACGTGKVCNASGSCVADCFIGGTLYASGAANPANPCEVCDPATATTAWSPGNAGATCQPTSCGAWGVCTYATTCTDTGSQSRTCTAYTCGGGTCNPSSSSQSQTCTRSTTGTGCASGKVCNASGSCVADCFIGGTLYASGQQNPANMCQVCAPATSTTAWSPGNAGATCQATSCGAWTTCTYASFCSNTGSRTRTCTAYTCGSGTCNGASSTQTDTSGCNRSQDGKTCGLGCNSTCSAGSCIAHCPSGDVCRCGGQCLAPTGVCP